MRRLLVLLLLPALVAGCTGARDGGPSGEDARGPSRPPVAAAPAERGELLEVVRRQLDSPLGEGESRVAADAVHAGELRLRDGTHVELEPDGSVPWAGSEDGTTTSQLRLLHGLLIVHDLVDSGRPSDLDRAYALVLDWVRENPREHPDHAMAWHDETTARRASALVRLHDAYETDGADPDGDRRRRLEALLFEHLELLLDDAFHATGTNHGMFQDRAVLFTSAYLELRGRGNELTAEAWATGSERLVAYYRSSLSDGGVHLEHAPAYHQLVAASARRDAGFLGAFDAEEAAELEDVHAAMVTYATHVVQPDGTWPLVSDTFTRDRPRPNLWDDAGYRYAVTGGAEGEAPAETAVAFPDAGYVIMRDRWSDDGRGTYVHFTAAYHGTYHKHADDLSVWLYHDGPLVTELGPQGYAMQDPLVQCGYSDAAHNIATVEGLELPRTDEWVGRTRLASSDLSGATWTATGVNERIDGASFERHVAYDHAAGVVEVTDRVETDVPRAVRLRWHLDPSVVATVDGDGVVAERDGSEPVTVGFRSEADLDVNVRGPDPDACTGLRFGGGEPIETSTVEVRTEPRQVTEIVSRFELL